MRLALAQVDVTVGDIAGNAARVTRALAEAERRGATFTLLPEMALTGYPPEDLLAKSHFVDDNLDALEQVAAAAGHAALVGFVDRAHGKLYNAAALVGNRRVLQVYRKRLLPNYGVFDERRWFEPGDSAGLIEIGGDMLAASVCEDAWFPEPVAEVAEAGARAVFNVSASPFHLGKGEAREEMLRRRARDNGVWLAFCNLVGGQDELVFDGRSALISPDGEVVARAASFAEDLLVADFSPGGRLGAADRVEPLLGEEEELYRALELGLGDYVRKNGFTDVVVGLSGGIDSALTAALAVDTLGPAHVHGAIMPSRYSSEGSVTDAGALADALAMDAVTLPIEGPFSAFLETLEPVFAGREPDVTEENLQARVRGTLLMALSNKFGWLVLATGNKSELSVGYSTLYGDMVGGFAPIRDVFKTRVYDLARWRNARPGGPVIPEATLTKVPSAELRPGQTDQDALPPYEELDGILKMYVEDDRSREEIVAAAFDAGTVAKVARMVDAAEYKRRQGPLGIKISPKAFGRDRRMPVTNRYEG
ncbi:MAG: NAD+ synthase [Coriobacteriia bacterium]|nr:NAD+ synthase [Coriobacteriia bacterium]